MDSYRWTPKPEKRSQSKSNTKTVSRKEVEFNCISPFISFVGRAYFSIMSTIILVASLRAWKTSTRTFPSLPILLKITRNIKAHTIRPKMLVPSTYLTNSRISVIFCNKEKHSKMITNQTSTSFMETSKNNLQQWPGIFFTVSTLELNSSDSTSYSNLSVSYYKR